MLGPCIDNIMTVNKKVIMAVCVRILPTLQLGGELVQFDGLAQKLASEEDLIL